MVTTVTIPDDLLADVDERAAELDMNRSQYFRYLARRDLYEDRPKRNGKRKAA